MTNSFWNVYERLKPQFIHAYTKRLPNLGTHNTELAKSSYPMVKGVTNKNTPIRESSLWRKEN